MIGRQRLWQRIAVALLLFACLSYLDPQSAHWLHRLIIPLGLALAAWLLTGALLAVALACFCLSLVHADLDSTQWIEAWAYPALATASLGVAAVIITRRFRGHIRETHDARWQNRT